MRDTVSSEPASRRKALKIPYNNCKNNRENRQFHNDMQLDLTLFFPGFPRNFALIRCIHNRQITSTWQGNSLRLQGLASAISITALFSRPIAASSGNIGSIVKISLPVNVPEEMPSIRINRSQRQQLRSIAPQSLYMCIKPCALVSR